MKRVLNSLLPVIWAIIATAIYGYAARPEFDAVGDDSVNYFNNMVTRKVVEEARDGFGNRINEFSSFSNEYFHNTAGQFYPDWCFEEYVSSLIDPWSEAVFKWQIVLQIKPQSDIDLEINHCVTDGSDYTVWSAASQTGRYCTPWGLFLSIPSANPSIAVIAFPGPYATPGFVNPFHLDAKVIPGLNLFSLADTLFPGKALWCENLLISLPATGHLNSIGETCYVLKSGDYLEITITVPYNNTAYMRYGQDNVLLKYIGVNGTEFSTALPAP